jgi:WD40 repeat protein
MPRLATIALLLLGMCGWAACASAQPEIAPAPHTRTTTKLDVFGEVLPERAVASIGTTRFMHANHVSAVWFTPNGKLFASAAVGEDGTDELRVWEWPSGKHVRTFGSILVPEGNLRFSPNGRYLIVVGLTDSEVTFVAWDLVTGRKVASKPITWRKPSVVLAATDTHAAVIDDGKTVQSVDLRTGKWAEPVKREHEVLAVTANRDGQILTVEAAPLELRIASIEVGKVDRRITVIERPERVVFGPDAHWVGIVSSEHELTTVALADGKTLIKPQELPAKAKPIAFSADGKRAILYYRENGQAIVRDLENEAEVCEIQTHAFRDFNAAFSADGKVVASCWSDGPHSATFRDAATGKRIEPFPGQGTDVSEIVFLPGDKEVVTISSVRVDSSVRVWDTETGKLLRSANVHSSGISRIAATVDGTKLVALGTARGEQIKVLDTMTLNTLNSYNPLPAPHPGMALWPDGSRVAIARIDPENRNNDFAVVDLATGKIVWKFDGKVNPTDDRSLDAMTRAQFSLALSNKELGWGFRNSADARLRGIPNWDRKIFTVVEAASGKTLLQHKSPVPAWAVAFRPDNRVLAIGDQSGKVRVLELSTGKELLSFQTRSVSVQLMEFSHDGRRLATVGSGDAVNRVDIWDVSEVFATPHREATARGAIAAWVKDLHNPDPKTALCAAWELIDRPDDAVPELKAAMAGLKPPDSQRIAALIDDLESEDFKTREDAVRELVRLGELVRKPATAAFAKSESPEQKRRLGEVLDAIKKATATPESIFSSRVVFVLERIATKEAIELLKVAASQSGMLAEEANMALARLGVKAKE